MDTLILLSYSVCIKLTSLPHVTHYIHMEQEPGYYHTYTLKLSQGSSHGTVVAHRTADKQVKQLILHLGHDSYHKLI